jgi:hypothetical protein
MAHNLNVAARQLINKNLSRTRKPRNPGTKPGLLRCSGQTPARVSRQRGGYAMWTSLFAVTFAIAIALSMAAIVVDSVNGGKFRL